MAEYIDRKKLLDDIMGHAAKHLTEEQKPHWVIPIAKIEAAPAEDVVTVEHGEWIDILEREVYLIHEKTTISLVEEKCSNCRVVTTFKGVKPYLADFVCPNCGAKMV